MQGKGIIKFFLVVMTLVTLVQYLFIIPTNRVERKAVEKADSACGAKAENSKEHKECHKTARIAYLDSMSSETVLPIPLLKDFSYEELKSRQLALGLDLKGGMSSILQVNLRDFIRTLANNSSDPPFKLALKNATAAQKTDQSDFVTLFADAYASIDDPAKKPLAHLFSRNESLRDIINLDSSDGEVISTIREEANGTVKRTFENLKERIDKFGTTQPNVSLDAARDMIVVELPGIDNPERARTMLTGIAELEFWNVYRVNDPGISAGFTAANNKLKQVIGGGETASEPTVVNDTTWTISTNDETGVVDSQMVVNTRQNDNFNTASGPLFERFQVNNASGGGLIMPASVMGLAEKNEMKQISKYLERDDVKSLFPNDISFKWGQKPASGYQEDRVDFNGLYELYAIKQDRGTDRAPLTGEVVTKATAQPSTDGNGAEVSLTMNSTGAAIWRNLTDVASKDQNRPIAITLDGEVVSAPNVNDVIAGGRSSITGNFSLQEASDLASVLQVGKLPAKIDIVQESLVGPSLGAKNIKNSITALAIGFALVFLFMIVYYGGAGIVSILCLFLNIFFIFGALASYGTVLTLPGIAGIVLTIGMAVDANVIIFERIREELRDGKSMLASINDGFKHSYSAIIDANITTILVAFVLAYFGLGPIKGFAVVLIIGVLSSLFTAVLVGRLLIDWWTGKGNQISFWSGMSKNAFANVNFDWLSKRKMAYMCSGLIIVAGLASMAIRGFEYGVDFKGGYSYNVQFSEQANVNAQQIRDGLKDVFGGAAPIVKAVDTDNTFNVVTSYMIDDNSDVNADSMVVSQLYTGVKGMLNAKFGPENFMDPDGTGTHITASSKIGPMIASDIKKSSIWATIFALMLIFLYIFMRFNKWAYSAGAVAALFHDVLIVLSLFSIFHGILPFSMEIDQAFIAALLTVIGYSINDTVVVFDRIREFMNTYSGLSKHEIINKAVNSTVSRTVITSLTTLFVVTILFIFGSGSIKGFAFALVIGILVGTYSSIFIATPVMSDLSGEITPKEVTKKKSFSKAASSK